MFKSGILFVILAIALTGCADRETLEYETRGQGLAIDGPWVPNPESVAMAANYDIGYVGAGNWVGSSGCSGSFTEGGRVFKDWILANWPQVSQVGGYACRPINGNSSKMSVHATGRALDIHIPLAGTQADNDLGDPLANWLIEHAEEIGVQMIIWDRWLWSTSREPRSRYYSGAHPHHDHLHVELTPAASRKQTPWFNGTMGAPDVPACDQALPAAGGIVDNADPCFVAFGPSRYWRRVDGAGNGGSLLWTNAFKSDSPSNWARWNLNLEVGGEYVVEYSRSNAYAVHDSVRYKIRAGGAEQEVTLDQSAGVDGWEEIGRFNFAAGGDQWVAVYDNTPFDVPSEQHIVADAIRITPVGATPAVDPNPTEPAGDPDIAGPMPDGPGPIYGETGNDPLPPKGTVEPDLHDTHDDDPDYELPAVIEAEGHVCSTTTAPAPVGPWGLLLLGLGMFGWLRRR